MSSFTSQARPGSQAMACTSTGAATFWYILKGTEKTGPFSFFEVVRLLQNKKINDGDFVWQKGMPQWRSISDLNQFSPQSIAELYSTGNLAADHIFVQRRHSRFPHFSPIVFHNNRRLWRGASFELSQGGAGIILEGAGLCPGQVLHSHFYPTAELEAFNVFCQIVGKQASIEVCQESTSHKYSIRFIDITDDLKTELETLSDKRTLDSTVENDGSRDAG